MDKGSSSFSGPCVHCFCLRVWVSHEGAEQLSESIAQRFGFKEHRKCCNCGHKKEHHSGGAILGGVVGLEKRPPKNPLPTLTD